MPRIHTVIFSGFKRKLPDFVKRALNLKFRKEILIVDIRGSLNAEWWLYHLQGGL